MGVEVDGSIAAVIVEFRQRYRVKVAHTHEEEQMHQLEGGNCLR